MRCRIEVLVISALGLALGLAISSCSKSSTSTPAETSSAPTTAPVAVTTVELGSSVGGDKRITVKTEEFRPNDTIYATVVTTGSAPNAVLKAVWTYQDGQVVNDSEETIAPTGEAATEFHISKPDGWPAGKYKLEIYLNGTSVQTKEFEVK